MERQDTGTDYGVTIEVPATEQKKDLAVVPTEPAKGGALGRSAFFKRAKDARKIERVDLPALGDDAHVYVRGLGATEKDLFEEAIYKFENGKTIAIAAGIRARLILLCTVDENGERIFEDDDFPALEKLDGKSADAIYAVGARLSGLTKDDVEALVKNSGKGRSDAR